MIPEEIKINNLRTFIPAKDYNISRKFYQKLGFTETWFSQELSVYQISKFSFYLQNLFVEDWANNFMLFLEVESCDAFWKYLNSLNLKEEFQNIKMIPPKTEAWGRECLLIDPTGVLWHFGEFV